MTPPCATCGGRTLDGTCLGSSEGIAPGECDNPYRCGTCGHCYATHTAPPVACAVPGCRCCQLTARVRFVFGAGEGA